MQNLTLKTTANQPFVSGKKIKAVMLFVAVMLFGVTANSQTYNSDFPTSTGNFSVVNPTGGGCLAPAFATPGNIADADLTNYASLSGLINTELLCTNPTYILRTRLNLPSGVTQVPIGYNAGFRISMAAVAQVSVLQSSITMRTYLGGVLAQTVTGTNIANIALLTSTGPADLFFVSTAPFDEIEIEINNGVIPISVGFDYRFYNAFATLSVLPVKFDNITAKLQGGRLNVDWTTASETNNTKFIVQGSNDGKSWTELGTVDTKAPNGQSSTQISYTFSRPWSSTAIAGFGLLGLLLLPAVRSRLLRLGMIVLVVSAVVSCSKDTTAPGDLETGMASGQNVYVRIAQVDKDGTSTYSSVVLAKK